MQEFVRKELDLQQPVNLRRLSPVMKIYAGFMSKMMETKFYKTALNKRKEEEYALRTQRDERLKEVLLAVIYRELNSNETMKEYEEECVEMIVCVKSNFIHSLDRIIRHKEFLPYDIVKVEEEADLRVAFPDMPILLCISKKSLQNEVML